MTLTHDRPVAAGSPRIGRPSHLLARLALGVLACLCMAGLAASSPAEAGPRSTRTVSARGRIVPIPPAIPHGAGDMVDRRIIPDLRWIAARFPIYITDGYAGPRPGSGRKVGCMCHTRGSDHYNGLAVDIVPVNGTTRCDRRWAPITRLARWAEPRQGHPVAPFRWVGYTGDVGHGCGNHLHLSWDHAPARQFRLASWVSVFSASGSGTPVISRNPPKPPGPSGGVQAGGAPPPRATWATGGVGGREL